MAIVRLRREWAVLLGVVVAILTAGCSSVVARSGSRSNLVTVGASNQGPSCVEKLGPEKVAEDNQVISPRVLSTPLKASVLRRFGIFRESTPNNQALFAAKMNLKRELGDNYELLSYYPKYLRLLPNTEGNVQFIVVPGFGRAENGMQYDCSQRVSRHEVRRERRRRPPSLVYCVLEIGGHKVAMPLGCEQFAAIDESRQIFRETGIPGRVPTVGLVPDGIASLRIKYLRRAPVVISVDNNAFVFSAPPPSVSEEEKLARLQKELGHGRLSLERENRLAQQWDRVIAEGGPAGVEWLDGSGHVVRYIGRPAGGRLRSSVGRTPIGG
jgi:hypothetical protein